MLNQNCNTINQTAKIAFGELIQRQTTVVAEIQLIESIINDVSFWHGMTVLNGELDVDVPQVGDTLEVSLSDHRIGLASILRVESRENSVLIYFTGNSPLEDPAATVDYINPKLLK